MYFGGEQAFFWHNNCPIEDYNVSIIKLRERSAYEK